MIKTSFILITIIIALSRCNFPTPLGEEIVEREVLDIIFIDTLGIRLSTVIFDSIVTSNSPRHLVGFHNNPEIGSVTSSAFIQFSIDSLTIPDDDATFQYAELEMYYDGYYHCDTSQLFTLAVHELQEELELNEEDYLTNISQFKYDQSGHIGQESFQPRPITDNEITLRIDDDYAKRIFMATQETDEEDLLEDFTEMFPGIVLAPDTAANNLFLGFSPLSKLIIHYRASGEDQELVFPLNANRFNQISNKRENTKLATLTTRKEDLTSLKTDNQAYLHNGIGMNIKVEIPFLRELRSVLESNFITEAILILKPVKGTYSNFEPLPDDLVFSEIDKLNRIELGLLPSGTLILDDEFKEDTEYRIDITEFIQEKIDQNSIEEHSILIQGSSETMGISVDQLVVGDRFSEYEASLELFILDYIIDN